MKKIRVVHISDLHISEHLLRDPDLHFELPHRYGHDIQVFLALDDFLNNNEWDVLVISGDVSRIGNSESFEILRNWLYNKINVEDIEVGLNISESPSKHCIIIPGNHDSFNGNLVQTRLENYNREFDEVTRDHVVPIEFDNKTVNFHLFDSTWEKGGFAEGRIDPTDMVVKHIDKKSYDIALMHHHFIQPPKHKREKTTELKNSEKVAAYMLNSGFNCVMFGHTHQGYIGKPSIEALTKILNDKRTSGKFWKKLAQKIHLMKKDSNCLVSYKRESTKSGQLPTMESYFNYLYISSNKNSNALPPSSFDTAAQFHEHIEEITNDESLSRIVKKLKEKRILVSLAPSACQAEAKWKGFNVVNIGEDNISSYDRYQFNGARFEIKERTEHLS